MSVEEVWELKMNLMSRGISKYNPDPASFCKVVFY